MSASACSSMLLLLFLLAHGAAAAAAHQQNAHSSAQARSASSGYTLEAEEDRVTFLPGGPAELDFGLFSGYVTVDESAGRALFYVFAEARTPEPTKAPLMLWLNGGPGCSSLGGGFMAELGPFYPTGSGTSLQANPYSWNNLTNVIWLESPAFVGFSYSNTSADQIVGDARTAADARLFLLHWMKRFPQYAAADLYLSGESYGGHYVPNLALEIVKGNKRAPTAAAAAADDEVVVAKGGSSSSSSDSSSDSDSVSPGKGYLNLKGFFVGNAWTDAAIDNQGALDFWYSHAMVSAEARTAITDNCDFNTIGPLMRGSDALTLPGTHRRNGSRTPPPPRQQPPANARLAAAAASADDFAGGSSSSSSSGSLVDGVWRDITATAAAKASQIAAMVSSLADGIVSAVSDEDTYDSTAAAAAAKAESADFSSGLGHAGAPGWLGYGSSSTTRFWERLGLSGFSNRDDRDLICARWLDIAQAELGNINIYEIYADVCVLPPPDSNRGGGNGSLTRSSRTYRGALLGHVHPRKRVAGGTGEDGDAGSGDGGAVVGDLPRKPRYDPCIDGEVETYFNLPAVQEALHANQSVKLPWRWTDCTQLISYSRDDLLASMLPVYKELLAAAPALKIWVFSGDVDGIVPVLGSRRWIESLHLPVAKPWRAWTSRTGQVGGWRIDYEGLTFATVRNSGHMVPYVTPERAFFLLGEFFKAEAASPAAAAEHSRAAGSGNSEIRKPIMSLAI